MRYRFGSRGSAVRPSGASGGLRALCVVAGLVSLSCSPMAQPGEDPEDFVVRIEIENLGTFAGGVDVTSSTGTLESTCPETLDPGESCLVTGTRTGRAIDEIELTAVAEAGGRFVQWLGSCANAMGPECTLDPGTEPEVSFDAQVEFEPAG